MELSVPDGPTGPPDAGDPSVEPLERPLPAVPVAGGRIGSDLLRILQTMPAAFCLLDSSWRFRFVNREAERLSGLPGGRLLGESLWTAFPRIAGSAAEAMYLASAATGRPMTFEATCPGAPEGWFEVRLWPGSEGLAVYVVDVSDRRDAAELAGRVTARSALLARVSAELSGETDTESALGRLARLVVPVLADACIVTVLDREGRARDVGSSHADPPPRPPLER